MKKLLEKLEKTKMLHVVEAAEAAQTKVQRCIPI
jgi:hypothetical protein